MNDDALFPPERFANLMRDAGIHTPEALMQFLRGGSQTAEAGEAGETAAAGANAEAGANEGAGAIPAGDGKGDRKDAAE